MTRQELEKRNVEINARAAALTKEIHKLQAERDDLVEESIQNMGKINALLKAEIELTKRNKQR